MIEAIIALAVLVFWLMLFFAVLDIKRNSIIIDKRLHTTNMILRELNKDKLPPRPCPKCNALAVWGQNNCAKCGQLLEW